MPLDGFPRPGRTSRIRAVSGEMREERKVVTALFADVVGSTQLTERMDPEDAREVLGGAVRRMVDAVEAFGGTVKDLAGDGILALFGAPVTHEDDAERAIRAALRIVERTDDEPRVDPGRHRDRAGGARARSAGEAGSSTARPATR